MRRNLNMRGETIIEVLIAIAVMSAALGGAFAISNRSQRTVQSNQERYQGTLIANQQADLIKLAQSDDGRKKKINDFGHSDGTKVFCMDVSGEVSDLTTLPTLPAECSVAYGPVTYRVSVQPVQRTVVVGNPIDFFVIKVEWDSISSSGGVDSIRLLYGI